MPYNQKQCRLFGAKQHRGEAVPRDWKEHCRHPLKKSRKPQTRDYKKE
jgi:predicted alpha/beta hydrolase